MNKEAIWIYCPVCGNKTRLQIRQDSLVSLCTDICKRNGKKKLLWLGDKSRTLNVKPNPPAMLGRMV